MAVIGGIFDPDTKKVDTGIMMDISRAMLARGGIAREAYINSGVGIFSGGGSADRHREQIIPCSTERRGKNLTAVMDGDLNMRNGGMWDNFVDSKPSGAQLALERYMSYGVRMGEWMEGEYSLAVCDEGRGELILLRDRKGSRPLFYTKEGRRIAFASEIKGIMRSMSAPIAVDTGRLRNHVFSPCQRSGADIYRDIYEIQPSGGCVCTALGVVPFSYSPPYGQGCDEYVNEVIDEEFVCPDTAELKKILGEVLFAFDYPQFDHLMPSFIRMLCLAKQRIDPLRFAVADGTLYMDLGYSTERRDRLCSSFGIYVSCAPPKKEAKERELKRLERNLLELLSKTDKALLYKLFGEDLEARISREKSVAKRIRIEGMLCQIPMWYRNYNIMFV